MNDNKSVGDSPYKNHQLDIVASSLRIDEDVLRIAGVQNYSIELRTFSNGNWNTLYEKKSQLPSANK